MIPRYPAGWHATAWLIRLGLLGAVALLILAATMAVGTASRPAAVARSGYDWVTSWGASPQDPSPGTFGLKGFHDQTVRDIIVPSVGGNMIRLELTNAFGRSPLQVGRVTVAVADLGARVVPGTIHPVSFGGSASVRIPAASRSSAIRWACRCQPCRSWRWTSPARPDRCGHPAHGRPAGQLGIDGRRRRPRGGGRRVHEYDPVPGTTSAVSTCGRPERPGPWSRSATRLPTA